MAMLIPIPAFAPVDKPPPVDCASEGNASADCVATLPPVAVTVVVAVTLLGEEAGVVVVVAAAAAPVEVVEVDEGRGLFVDTIAPKPFRTIPRFSEQHGGSLSQQKLPSVHSTARGKKPVPGSMGFFAVFMSVLRTRQEHTIGIDGGNGDVFGASEALKGVIQFYEKKGNIPYWQMLEQSVQGNDEHAGMMCCPADMQKRLGSQRSAVSQQIREPEHCVLLG
ncbi:hypothetical protein PV08_01159 [Exophiala spinifera]|uniref:Uncharacterized protein n=1 Tax=Exophiala spinifera TaxID=91928 RepID=A0A0D2CAI7_9EURO|nr:uncharacterized protein PV08_01159 [Exophiala spinifera]KIW20584.1 hypothetical protein PV08_01159 [Exophiala spinifera]